MLGAASVLIREWAETLLDAKFSSLCALGKYLVNNLCVDNRSLAAVCMLSASADPQLKFKKGLIFTIIYYFYRQETNEYTSVTK